MGDHHFSGLTVIAFRIILDELLKTLPGLLIISLPVSRMGIDQPLFLKNPIRRFGVFFQKLLVFTERCDVAPLTGIFIRFF